MRRLVLTLALILLPPLAVPIAAQETGFGLPQVRPSATPLRALTTADDVRAWEAVGRLDTGVSFCTAALIEPDLVLTAAHCLFDENGGRLADGSLTFSASLRNGRAEAVRGVTRSILPQGYVRPAARSDFRSVEMDMALLVLDRPVSEAIVRPLRIGSPAERQSAVTLVSYGAEREDYPSIEENCSVLSRDGRVSVLSCRVVSGSSGAPVIRTGPAGPEVVAVVSGRGEMEARDITVAVTTQGLLQELLTARDAATRQGSAITVRRLGESGGREGTGARFLRP